MSTHDGRRSAGLTLDADRLYRDLVYATPTPRRGGPSVSRDRGVARRGSIHISPEPRTPDSGGADTSRTGPRGCGHRSAAYRPLSLGHLHRKRRTRRARVLQASFGARSSTLSRAGDPVAMAISVSDLARSRHEFSGFSSHPRRATSHDGHSGGVRSGCPHPDSVDPVAMTMHCRRTTPVASQTSCSYVLWAARSLKLNVVAHVRCGVGFARYRRNHEIIGGCKCPITFGR
jgi:hypothetical protein